MTSRFLDTNVLLYSITASPLDAAKRDRAIEVTQAKDNALSVQVLQEFYVQATRPTRPDAISHETAVELIRAWLRFPVQDITVAVMSEALRIKASYRLSYWDAAIVAAARALGCREIYSEDMSHGRDIEGTVIVNPFL
jgi:predicted nucleic acid-binding protein